MRKPEWLTPDAWFIAALIVIFVAAACIAPFIHEPLIHPFVRGTGLLDTEALMQSSLRDAMPVIIERINENTRRLDDLERRLDAVEHR